MSTARDRHEAYYTAYQSLGDTIGALPDPDSTGYEIDCLLNAEANMLTAANNALVTLLDTLAALIDLTDAGYEVRGNEVWIDGQLVGYAEPVQAGEPTPMEGEM